MIFIGYQGIGKSTLAGPGDRFIDLESGNFWVDGKRPEYWYKYYCNIAEHLSQQGFDVFVSSHEVVRKQLKGSEERICIICPDLSLKDQWIEKLKTRYENTKLDKDYKAYMNAVDRYEENIKELLREDFDHLVLADIGYRLSANICIYLELIDDYNVKKVNIYLE